jgi:hypothetical protein
LGSFIEKFKPLIITRVSDLSEKDLKELDRQSYVGVLKQLASLLKRANVGEEHYEQLELLELNLSLTFIKCGLLEKRLKGVGNLSAFIARVNSFGTKQAQKPPKWVNVDRLQEWILSERVVELLLVEYLHVEVIKRCKEILGFLAGRSALLNENLDLLLEAC